MFLFRDPVTTCRIGSVSPRDRAAAIVGADVTGCKTPRSRPMTIRTADQPDNGNLANVV